MLAIFGAHRTEIMSESNVTFSPATIDEYAGIQAAVTTSMKEAIQNQSGDPNKAAERLVDGVKGQGGAKGRRMPLRLVIGADAFRVIRDKCQMMLNVCDEWEEFGANTNYDGKHKL